MQNLKSQIPNLKSHTGARRRPVAVDLFSGAGGFSLGMEQAGFDVLVAVEYDPVHACTYAFNFPLTEVLCADASSLTGDIIKQAADRSWEAHREAGGLGSREQGHFSSLSSPSPLSPLHPAPSPSKWNGQIDLVFGGPPCQGFSLIGKRNLNDDRNNLIFHFYRLVMELNPRYFVMENVPGMAVGEHKIFLRQLKSKFESAGYDVRMRILNAADFGVPQSRKRLFVLGTQENMLPLSFPHTPVISRVTVGDAIADLPDLEIFPELETSDEVLLTDEQLEHLNAKASRYVQILRSYPSPKTGNLSYPRLWNPQWLTSSMRTHHGEETRSRFAAILPNEIEPISHLRRLDLNGLCHTLRAGTDATHGSHTSPRPIHPIKARAISVREAARLHSFPDWFRFHHTKWHGFRQVGNAVPPLLASAIGKKITASLCVNPTVPKIPLVLGDTQLLRFDASDAASYWQGMK